MQIQITLKATFKDEPFFNYAQRNMVTVPMVEDMRYEKMINALIGATCAIYNRRYDNNS